MVPQPSFAGDHHIRDLQTYGYRQGTFLGNSGNVRATVSADKAVIECVKAASDRAIGDTLVIAAK